MIESIPKELTLSEKAYYPPDELLLFDRYNRHTFLEQHGEQADVYDPERPPKHWADTSIEVPDGTDPTEIIVEYEWFHRPSRTWKTFRINAADAMRLNLPGQYDYPEAHILPTPAVVVGPDGDEQGLNPTIICYRDEADKLAVELSGSVIESASVGGVVFTINWKGEDRRRWLVVTPQRTSNAAALLRMQRAQGIGAPGEWTWVKAGVGKEPRWLSHQEVTGDEDPRPEVSVPCRRLFDEEAIWVGWGGTVMIYRKDMESPYNPAGGGGGLTVGQAKQLTEIHEDVAAMAEKFGIE